jgi:hypothetical protein
VGRQESWLSRVQLHSTDLHHGLKTVGSLFKNTFLTRVHSCSQIFDSCSLVFVIFDSCSLVFVSFWLVFTRVHSCSDSCSLVFTRVHSCSDSCGLIEQIELHLFSKKWWTIASDLYCEFSCQTCVIYFIYLHYQV